MDADRFANIRTLFEQLIELPADQRPAFLDQQCADDPELRRELEQMLDAVEVDTGFLEPPVQSDDPAAPDTIGDYRIERLIASGGMGNVYLATQSSPRRSVALKTMRSSLATDAARRRFQFEAEILARLRHPGIAQIIESGTHVEQAGATPQLYFVMEYVPDARNLIVHAEERRLDVDQRLELFLKVCDAVHFGHQQGVIHRDLKPSNILVDGNGFPKIIDFGVARAADPDPEISVEMTRTGEIVGTLRYMSPEQVSGVPEDVDTRTDVYALGAVLYQLLTGQPPFPMTQQSLTEAVRVIAEVDPTRPGSLRSDLAPELDWILLHSLEKDKEHRYGSVSELAADLRRYLDDEPVLVGPPSTAYRLSRFVRRHRGVVLASALALLLLIGGALGTTFGMLQAWDEAEYSAKVQFFLEDMLHSAKPTLDGRDVRVIDVLGRFASGIDESFPGEPEVAATLHRIAAETFQLLGHLDDAELHSLRALELLGDDPESMAEERIELEKVMARVDWRRGKLDEATARIERTLKQIREVGGADPKSERRLLCDLADLRRECGQLEDALDIGLQAVEHSRMAADQLSLIQSLRSVGQTLRNLGRNADAVAPLEEATRLAERVASNDLPMLLGLRNSLGITLLDLGELDLAAEQLAEVYQETERVLGADHQDTVTCRSNYAGVLKALGRIDETREHYAEILQIQLRERGDRHPHTLYAQVNLAGIHSTQGEFTEALELFEKAADGATELFGETDRRTLDFRSFQARELLSLDRAAEAEPILRAVLSASRSRFGAGDRITRDAGDSLVSALVDLGRTDEAKQLRAELERQEED